MYQIGGIRYSCDSVLYITLLRIHTLLNFETIFLVTTGESRIFARTECGKADMKYLADSL